MKKIYLFSLSFLMLGAGYAQQKTTSSTSNTKKVKLVKEGYEAQYLQSLKDKKEAQQKGLNTFWTDNFDTPSDWIIFNEGVPSTDWVIGMSGPTGFYSASMGAINSASTGNFGLYDSDGLGSSYDDVQEAFLQYGHSINCTGKNNVRLSFESYYRRFNDNVFVEVSNDSVNWTQYEVHLDVNQDASSDNPTQVVVNVSDVADDEFTVYVRFHFSGNWDYAWMVDDVKLSELTGIDGEMIALGPVPGWEYQLTPVAQTLNDYDFTGFVENVASDDITTAFVTIASPAIAYSENVVTGTITSGNFEEVSSAYDGADLGGVGTLQILYDVQVTNGTDENLLNNVDTFNWNFTDSTLGHLLSVEFVNTGIDSINSANFFEIYNQDTLTSVSSFMYFSAEAVGEQVQMFVQEVLDTTLGNILAVSEPYTVTPADTGLTGVSEQYLSFPDVVLPTGNYIVGFNDVYSGICGVAWNTAFDLGVSFISQGMPSTNYANFSSTYAYWLHFGVPSMTVSVDDIAINTEFNVYPNPTSNIVNVEFANENASKVSFELYNTVGQLVETQSFNSSNIVTSFDVSSYAAGMYNLKVISDAGVSVNKIEVK